MNYKSSRPQVSPFASAEDLGNTLPRAKNSQIREFIELLNLQNTAHADDRVFLKSKNIKRCNL